MEKNKPFLTSKQVLNLRAKWGRTTFSYVFSAFVTIKHVRLKIYLVVSSRTCDRGEKGCPQKPLKTWNFLD